MRLEMALDDGTGVAHGGSGPARGRGLDPLVEQLSERAGPDPSAARLGDQVLELLASVPAGAMDGLAEPSRPPRRRIGAKGRRGAARSRDREGASSPFPSPAILCGRSWTSDGQLMDKFVPSNSPGAESALVSVRVLWSGRRDSNPRPPPWQGGALPLSHVRAEASSLGAGSGAFNRLSERRMPAHVSNERYILEDDKHEVLFRDLETVGEHAGIRVLQP
jgi:hypothetical protein